jgi:hypothetical protein
MQTQAQLALFAPGSEVTALRELFTELLRDPRNVAHIANLMAGADTATRRESPTPTRSSAGGHPTWCSTPAAKPSGSRR